jgi:hypothetical protein
MSDHFFLERKRKEESGRVHDRIFDLSGRGRIEKGERKETYQYRHAGLESARTINTCNRSAVPHVLSGPIRVAPQSVPLKKRTWSVVGI